MTDQEIVLDAEEQALKRAARLAGYRKTIAEGAAATMPDLSVELPDRSLDVGDGVSQLPGLVAQDVADPLADEIVQQMVNDTALAGRTVLVVTDLDVTAASGAARQMLTEMTELTRRLSAAEAALIPPEAASPVPLPTPPEHRDAGAPDPDAQRPSTPDLGDLMDPGDLRDVPGLDMSVMMALGAPAILAGLQGLQAAAKAVPAVLEFVQTDLTVRPSTVEVTDEVIVAAVARTLRQRDVSVRIASCTTIPDNEITTGMREVAMARDSLADALATFTAQHLEGGRAAEVGRQHAVLDGLLKAHDALLGKPDDRTELQARIVLLQRWLAEHLPEVERARAAAATATARLAEAKTFLTANRERGTSSMAPMTMAALLHEAARDGSDVDILNLTCTSAVGETVWKERWRGDQALHIGGLGASWMLLGGDGLIKSSGERTRASSVTVKLGEPMRWPPTAH